MLHISISLFKPETEKYHSVARVNFRINRFQSIGKKNLTR